MGYYERGQVVEITNKEEGLEGSYYTANIISSISDKDYIIQYKTLTKEDHSGPLREVVSADQIRPLPPDIPISITSFSKSDIVVDAYEKDGWWVGKIMGKKRGSDKYLVRFENTGEQIAYPLGKLRFHQDWVNGHWVSPNK